MKMETYGEAAATVGISMMQDPAKSVEILRSMFEEQRACPFEPFAGPDTTVEELVYSFAFWIDALREVMRSFGENNFEPHVAKAVAESGLLDLYQDVMLWSDFFSQHRRFIEDVMKGFFGLFLFVSDDLDPHLHGLRQRAPELWAHIWRNRDTCLLWSFSAGDLGRGKADTKPNGSAMLQLVLLYQQVCSPWASTDTHIPHIILYSWAMYRGLLSDLLDLDLEFQEVVNYLYSGLNVESRSRARYVDHLLEEAIIGTVGLDALFAQFSRGLRDAHDTLNIKLYAPCIRLLELVSCGSAVDAMPYLIQHEIMRLGIATFMESRLENGVAMPGIRYVDMFLLFRTAFKHYMVSGNVTLQGADAVAFLSSCIDAVVANGVTTDLSESFGYDVLRSVDDLCQLVKSATEPGTTDIVDSMRIGARAYWYPTLARLSTEATPKPQDKVIVLRLRDAWESLGKVLGLDAQQERQKYLEESRIGCSWRNCPRRGQISAGGETFMSRCSGCKDARYCSTQCQKRDWRHGKHKARCGKKVNS